MLKHPKIDFLAFTSKDSGYIMTAENSSVSAHEKRALTVLGVLLSVANHNVVILLLL